jgi:hypothetical protein
MQSTLQRVGVIGRLMSAKKVQSNGLNQRTNTLLFSFCIWDDDGKQFCFLKCRILNRIPCVVCCPAKYICWRWYRVKLCAWCARVHVRFARDLKFGRCVVGWMITVSRCCLDEERLVKFWGLDEFGWTSRTCLWAMYLLVVYDDCLSVIFFSEIVLNITDLPVISHFLRPVNHE